MPRKYTLKKRAEKQAETREQILDAIVALHEELGPAQTTISAIAERAGVQRLTVYRHFPDEQAMFEACRDHWAAAHPAPVPERWRDIADPKERLSRALLEMYRFYEHGEKMIALVYRDAEVNPHVAQAQRPFIELFHRIEEDLRAGWDVPPERANLLAAAIGHALSFTTWQSLSGVYRLEADQIARVMTCLVDTMANGDCQV